MADIHKPCRTAPWLANAPFAHPMAYSALVALNLRASVSQHDVDTPSQPHRASLAAADAVVWCVLLPMYYRWAGSLVLPVLPLQLPPEDHRPLRLSIVPRELQRI